MLLSPYGAMPSRKFTSQADTSSEGVVVTAPATPHTKPTTWTEVIASTNGDSIGVLAILSNTANGNTDTRALVDIGIGSAGAEDVLLPDLDAGFAGAWSGIGGQAYFFPLHSIPAGSRISARAQAAIASDQVNVSVHILGGRRIPGYWTGSRVTAYGVDSANSCGTAVTPGNSSAWGTAVQVSSSTANPIRCMQMGYSTRGDPTLTNQRLYGRIGVGASPVWLVSELPFGEFTTSDTMHTAHANWLLSHMHIPIPAGSDLRFAAMNSGTGEVRSIIIYGVD